MTDVLLLIHLVDWRQHRIFDDPVIVGLVLVLGAALLPSGRRHRFGRVGGRRAGVAFLAQHRSLRRRSGRPVLGSGEVLPATLIGTMGGGTPCTPS